MHRDSYTNIRQLEIHPSQQQNHPSIPTIQQLTMESAYFKQQLDEAFAINASLMRYNHTLTNNSSIKIEEKEHLQASIITSLCNEDRNLKIQQAQSSSNQLSGSLDDQNKPRKISRVKREDTLELRQDKNETKNIPKNYGKAILSFIQKNIWKYDRLINSILSPVGLRATDLILEIKKHKREVNSINYLKLIWGHKRPKDPIFKCIRILSFIFMRKYCLQYIFNSRVKNYTTHIKYRNRIIKGIENPDQFTYIKQF